MLDWRNWSSGTGQRCILVIQTYRQPKHSLYCCLTTITVESDEPNLMLIAKELSLELPGMARSQFNGADKCVIQYSSTLCPTKVGLLLSPKRNDEPNQLIVAKTLSLSLSGRAKLQYTG